MAVPHMNNLADVLHDEFEHSWQEAVAIVQQLASQLPPGQAVPSLEHLSIADDGTLLVDAVGGSGATGAEPAAALAALLQRLLAGTQAPPQLMQLAAEHASGASSHATIASFMRALGFFERPGRNGDLIALASRLRGFVPPQPEAELERLRQKLASTPDVPVARRLAFRRPGRRVAIAAGLIVLLLASTGFLALAGRTSGRRSLTSVLGRALDRAETKLSRVFAGGTAPASNAAAPAPSAPVKASAARSVRPSPRKRSESVPARRAADILSETTPPANPLDGVLAAVPSLALRTSRESAVLLAPLTNVAIVPSNNSPIEPAGEKPVYSSADAAVRPPALMRPQLPSRPDPTDQTSYYEILVDETGAAAYVKVVSPVRRYYDGMLVAAAKAWTFKPAVRDGRPVKYWVRVPINVADGWQ
jgi:hypothetical protein